MTIETTEPKNTSMSTQSSTLRDHPPAQMVGGMRVRQAHRRHSLSKQDSHEQDQSSSDEGDEQQRMEQKEKQKQEQVRQENTMRAQQAARDFNVSRNAGSHVHARIDPSFQPRDLNH